MAPPLLNPQRYNLDGNLEDIAPILHAPGAISVHGSFRQASLEPESSGQKLRTLPTGQLSPELSKGYEKVHRRVKIFK